MRKLIINEDPNFEIRDIRAGSTSIFSIECLIDDEVINVSIDNTLLEVVDMIEVLWESPDDVETSNKLLHYIDHCRKDLSDAWTVNQSFEITYINNDIIQTTRNGSVSLLVEVLKKRLLISARLLNSNIVTNRFEQEQYTILYYGDLSINKALSQDVKYRITYMNNRQIHINTLADTTIVLKDLMAGKLLSVEVTGD